MKGSASPLTLTCTGALMSLWDGIHAHLNSSCGEKESLYLSLTCTECREYLG